MSVLFCRVNIVQRRGEERRGEDRHWDNRDKSSRFFAPIQRVCTGRAMVNSTTLPRKTEENFRQFWWVERWEGGRWKSTIWVGTAVLQYCSPVTGDCNPLSEVKLSPRLAVCTRSRSLPVSPSSRPSTVSTHHSTQYTTPPSSPSPPPLQWQPSPSNTVCWVGLNTKLKAA